MKTTMGILLFSMPFFCNKCDDVVETRKKNLNWKALLIISGVIGIVFGIIGAMVFGGTGFILGFLIAFLITAGIIAASHSEEKPLCINCKGTDYYEIAPHEAATIRHAKKMREEQREFQRTTQQQMQTIQQQQMPKSY